MKKILLIILSGCLMLPLLAQKKGQGIFVKLDRKRTGIDFTNNIREDDSLHVMKYEYLYNGHGVGIGDFNNDGLADVFISGNTSASKLYLNTGSMRFRDITKEAGIQYKETWATGVSVADVNGDGLLDIYVCHSGSFKDPAKLSNELFINQGISDGVPTFREMAAEFGLDAPGTQSTQALFFDYDLDGDLDMFLLNHSNHTYNPFLNTRKIRSEPHMQFGNRLFRNDVSGNKMKFTDVTLKAGIVNNALNFGLSVNASDINGDGYPEIFTTSDYTEKDCLYINNKDGSFTESIEKSFAHMSKYSMGSDIADYNNDGLFDILTLDMLPADNYRQKLLKGPDEYDQYHLLADSGYYHQQMRNMLQLNQGADEKGNMRFSEIGQLAGVSNTDWSWAGLFADLDNDGWKDLLITNGYLRDFTNLDFLRYSVSDAQLNEAKKGNFNFKTFDLVKKMPSNKLSSYVYKNSGDLRFEDMSKSWGIDEPAVSNGAAYADLDNDGDLDLIICRNNEPVAVYQNSAQELSSSGYVQISLKGEGFNTSALGAKVYVYTNGLAQVQEVYPVRGYQSSVSTILHFGIGANMKADSCLVVWPDQKTTRLYDLPSSRIHTLLQRDANTDANTIITQTSKTNRSPQFHDITRESGLLFKHKENPFVDFKDEVLLPYQLSRSGPALATADVNGDGWDDVFLGGAIEQPSVLFLQQTDGTFTKSPSQPWTAEAACEDVNAIFFDADGDKDLDLYVVSGGNEYGDGSPEYADRLYLNDGKGSFTRTTGLPNMLSSKQAIAAGDFDRDGDLDLFVGGRSIPGSFPLPARSYILRNESKDGRVVFSDATAELGPELLNPGIVNDAKWIDIDKDGYDDLFIAGDWMPLMLWKNTNGKFSDISKASKLGATGGLWNSVNPIDIDNDGDIDFVMGNAGTNNQFNVSPDKPLEMFAADFDNNGTIDPIICYYINDRTFPMASRDELLEQIPAMRKKFVFYKDYAASSMETIFTKDQIGKARKFSVETLESAILYNDGQLNFRLVPLPLSAQFSSVNGIIAIDINNDEKKDLVIAGNKYNYRVQLGRSDASFGLTLLANADNSFSVMNPADSKLFASGDIRNIRLIQSKKGVMIVMARNNDEASLYQLK